MVGATVVVVVGATVVVVVGAAVVGAAVVGGGVVVLVVFLRISTFLGCWIILHVKTTSLPLT